MAESTAFAAAAPAPSIMSKDTVGGTGDSKAGGHWLRGIMATKDGVEIQALIEPCSQSTEQWTAKSVLGEKRLVKDLVRDAVEKYGIVLLVAGNGNVGNGVIVRSHHHAKHCQWPCELTKLVVSVSVYDHSSSKTRMIGMSQPFYKFLSLMDLPRSRDVDIKLHVEEDGIVLIQEALRTANWRVDSIVTQNLKFPIVDSASFAELTDPRAVLFKDQPLYSDLMRPRRM